MSHPALSHCFITTGMFVDLLHATVGPGLWYGQWSMGLVQCLTQRNYSIWACWMNIFVSQLCKKLFRAKGGLDGIGVEDGEGSHLCLWGEKEDSRICARRGFVTRGLMWAPGAPKGNRRNKGAANKNRKNPSLPTSQFCPASFLRTRPSNSRPGSFIS